MELSPPVVKQMTMFELAGALGVGTEYDEPDEDGAPSSVKGVDKSDMDLIRQRVLASQGLAEAPTPKVQNQMDIEAFTAAMALPSM